MADPKPRRPRAANGEARPKKRKDGRWEARHPELSSPVYGKTAREAREKRTAAVKAAREAALRAALEPPKPEPSEELSGAYLLRWLEHHKVTKPLEDRTARDYERRIRAYVLPTLSDVPLKDLTVRHFDELNSDLQGRRKLSASTVRGTLIIVREALNFAVRWDLLTVNVAKRAGMPKVGQGPGKSLTREQVNRLLAAGKGDPLHSLFGVAVHTGMRQAELFALGWEDVDFQRGQITVRRSLDRPKGGGWRLKVTKTDRVRIVPLNAAGQEILKAQRNRQRMQRLKAGADWQEHGFVFTSEIGTPLFGGNTDVTFHTALARAGITGYRFHDLRHTAATLMRESGMSLVEIQHILGHSTIKTTADIYSHVAEPVLWDGMRRFGAYLEGNG